MNKPPERKRAAHHALAPSDNIVGVNCDESFYRYSFAPKARLMVLVSTSSSAAPEWRLSRFGNMTNKQKYQIKAACMAAQVKARVCSSATRAEVLPNTLRFLKSINGLTSHGFYFFYSRDAYFHTNQEELKDLYEE